MSEKTKADLMWDSQRVFDGYEMALHELCEQHKIPYQDWTHDSYDGSLELYGFMPGYKLSKAQQIALWAFGFWQCWTHTAKRHNAGDEEHHYSASKASQIEIQAARCVGDTIPKPVENMS